MNARTYQAFLTSVHAQFSSGFVMKLGRTLGQQHCLKEYYLLDSKLEPEITIVQFMLLTVQLVKAVFRF